MLRQLSNTVFLTLLLLTSWGCAAEDEKYKAGLHYEVLPQAVRTADPSKIEVNEIFSYHCGHCFNFESVLEPWIEKLPDDVDVQRTPAIWQPAMEVYARAYYSGVMLKVLDQVHMPIFKAIHVKHDPIRSEKDLVNIFAAAGVDSVKLSQVFNSFGMTSMINQAKARGRSYRTQGTPEMVVNGRYRISARMAGGFEGMLNVAEFLISKERAVAK